MHSTISVLFSQAGTAIGRPVLCFLHGDLKNAVQHYNGHVLRRCLAILMFGGPSHWITRLCLQIVDLPWLVE